MPLRLFGVILTVVGFISMIYAYAAYAAPAPLIDDVLSYEPPYYPPYEPPGGTPEGGTAQQGGGSPTDNRIGYVPDEYFTLYCSDNLLRVWRGVPQGLELAVFPLADLLGLPVNNYTTRGANTVTRLNEDLFMVSGSNGNLAPAPGTKVFSMAECGQRNGSLPEPALPDDFVPPQPDVNSCEVNSFQRKCYTDEFDYCIAIYMQAAECDQYIPSGLDIIISGLINCLLSLFIPVGAGMVFVSYTRPKRKKDK